nr:hypothetical protein CFP56_59281 [Quercus suber]
MKEKLWTTNIVRPYICHLDRRNWNRSFCQNIIHPDKVRKAQRDGLYTYPTHEGSTIEVQILPPELLLGGLHMKLLIAPMIEHKILQYMCLILYINVGVE